MDRPDLAGRLDQARHEHQPLADRVAQLQSALNSAVAEHRDDDADAIRADLYSAREEAAIAGATVAALAEASAEVERLRAADLRQIEEERTREAARHEYQRAHEAALDADAEMQRLIAVAHAGVDAVRQTLTEAFGVENACNAERQRAADASATADGRPTQTLRGTNAIMAIVQQDPVLNAIMTGRA